MLLYNEQIHVSAVANFHYKTKNCINFLLQFKDLTSLPVLFELHTIMCSVPLSSYFIDDIQQIQKNVIDTLVAYTQPVVTVKDTDEGFFYLILLNHFLF